VLRLYSRWWQKSVGYLLESSFGKLLQRYAAVECIIVQPGSPFMLLQATFGRGDIYISSGGKFCPA
jgi:hypothetical protein